MTRERNAVRWSSLDEIVSFVADVQQCLLPREAWDHEAHLTIAAWFLSTAPADEAGRLIRRAIQAVNACHGIQVRPMGGYHETLTAFWIEVVRRRLMNGKPGQLLLEAINDVCREFGQQKNLAEKYYSPNRLWSDEARTGWVEPDLMKDGG